MDMPTNIFEQSAFEQCDTPYKMSSRNIPRIKFGESDFRGIHLLPIIIVKFVKVVNVVFVLVIVVVVDTVNVVVVALLRPGRHFTVTLTPDP